jgi:hypothetical protein
MYARNSLNLSHNLSNIPTSLLRIILVAKFIAPMQDGSRRHSGKTFLMQMLFSEKFGALPDHFGGNLIFAV